MLVGTQVMEEAMKQEKELRRANKVLSKEQREAKKLQSKLQERDTDFNEIKTKFNSLQEELDFKTSKLENLWMKFQEVQNEVSNIQEDFDRERNDMYDTIFELTNQLKLKNLIIENFIPDEEFKKVEKNAEWKEDINDWVIKNATGFAKKDNRRPQSAVGMKRPTSEYSRIAKGLGDLNPRYKFDNILQLDLDMPERTTEDYDGMPSAKIQSAITAILNDDEAQQENVPITALVNFQDQCL